MSKEPARDDYFKIDPEPHLIGDLEPINHFPGVQMWWKAIDSIKRPLLSGTPPEALAGMEAWEMEKSGDPANLLRAMRKVAGHLGRNVGLIEYIGMIC